MGATMALLALIYTVVLCFSTFTSLDKGAAKFVSFSHYQNLKPLHNIISRNLMSSPLFISPSKVTERKAKKTHLRNQKDNDGGGKGSTNIQRVMFHQCYSNPVSCF